MKNFALYTLLVTVISFNCLAQSNGRLLDESKIDSKQFGDMMASGDLAVVSYHVEERVNMNFGGSITTYDVPSLSMISTKDLGKNNTRTITPKYAKVRAKTLALTGMGSMGAKLMTSSADAVTAPINSDLVKLAERKRDFVNIDVVATYERVMDKGYKSITMITKVADRHFFNGDMALAAKWYTELFNSTTNLEAVYYYRYAQSLIETGQKAKGEEMMKIFETKSL